MLRRLVFGFHLLKRKLFINAFMHVDIIIHAPLVVSAALVVGSVWGEGERERERK